MKKLRTICFFGCHKIEKQKKTYIDLFIEDTGLQMEELKTLMANREE